MAKMGRQRNRLQTKERESSPEELDETEASNLSDREFRVMIIRIFNSMEKKKTHRNHKKGPVRNKECNI